MSNYKWEDGGDASDPSQAQLEDGGDASDIYPVTDVVAQGEREVAPLAKPSNEKNSESSQVVPQQAEPGTPKKKKNGVMKILNKIGLATGSTN